ncbi:uncharacterized protein MYCFIDRAFT_53431 [Pseudocercospora fijiensis CIRAD86]|uniref:J domain-containing protein n=1 Tax=Pseudocercospora fijiensis (strain CIRAD86) TaxID=383855 RepID=M3A2K1_PSEFD|nr:uncharacterized protein MYCFIDRAFT_53431 [Pseudocercospora fijiensis CIRAD86]EME85404.1 hypothetical protein MYCFIDRAFT_53431 [Pseudocercospora fijiensis CIRAD86]
MSNEYNYDADAQFFPYFVLTMTSLVTLPLTYSLLRTPTDTSALAKAGHIDSGYKPDNEDIILAQRAKQKRKELRLKRMLTAVTGWLVMAYMVYLVLVTARTETKIWDPYSILNIGMSATEKEINSRYRRLSITMHPDKRQPNPALNETEASINDDWVEIVKAYKALTDEEIRNNYQMYGHPDGKQSASFGIALPQFLVAEGSGKYILAMYGLLLGIGLPWLVGKWWYGMQKQTRERILVTSAGNMVREYKERMDGGDVVSAISTAVEFRDILHGTKSEQDLGKLENRLLSNPEAALLPKDQTKLQDLEDQVRRKTLALLWAYLTRTDLGDKTLEAEKFEIAPTAEQMNQAFISITLAFGFTAPLMSTYHVNQSLVQAVPPSSASRSPLLQLPHFTSTAIRQIENAANTNKEHMTIQSFMALPAEQRQALAQAAGITNDKLKVAEGVAMKLPYLRVEKAFFKVAGEKYIIPSSLVQMVIKARFIPPGTPASRIPKVDEKDLLDIDPAEGDVKAQKIEQEQNPVPLAHAPFFAKDRAPKWHVFLADGRQGKIAVPPFTFVTFDKKPFDADGKPTYIGFDYKQDISLNVDDPSKAQEVDDDEISEPEEDTIAGQMAALQGKPTADADRPRRNERLRKKLEEDSDYESGTDDEDQDSESETDTDTDSEAEDAQVKKKGWW